MGDKLLKIIAVLAFTACSLMMAAVIIYAWYAHSDDVSANGNMGKVTVGVSEAVKVGDAGTADFSISNSSNIDVYMRLGWTPVYKDSNGRELTTDVSGIDVTDVTILGDSGYGSPLYGIAPVAGEIQSMNGYTKKMIELVDGSGNYLVIPAGTDVQVQLSVKTANQLKADEDLYIVVITEALQATRKAVSAATAYGWDRAKVLEQARSVIADATGGDK